MKHLRCSFKTQRILMSSARMAPDQSVSSSPLRDHHAWPPGVRHPLQQNSASRSER